VVISAYISSRTVFLALACFFSFADFWFTAKDLHHGKKINALCSVYIDSNKKDAAKTKVIKDNDSPVWNDEVSRIF